jgi:hypothetical protein
MIKRKILFLKSGSFSEINKNVYNFLTEEFPDCSVEIYDTKAKDINFLYYRIWIRYPSGQKKLERSAYLVFRHFLRFYRD